MSTITYEHSKGGGFNFLKLLLILAFIILLAVTISTVASHGLSTHPDTYPQVIKCLNDGNFKITVNTGNNRFIEFCMIDQVTFGMRVLDKIGRGQYREITAYIKDNIHSLKELQEFILRRGYSVIQTLPK